jgi:hypothetical protein
MRRIQLVPARFRAIIMPGNKTPSSQDFTKKLKRKNNHFGHGAHLIE